MYKLRKEIVKSVVIGLLIFIILQLLNLIINKRFPTVEILKWNFFFTLLYSVVLYFANAFIFIQLDKYFEKNRFHLKRLIIGFLASFLISIIAIFVLRIVEEVIFVNHTFSEFLKNESATNYIVALVITIIVSMGIHLVYFYKNYQENRVNQEK